jgi:hypothetical protein
MKNTPQVPNPSAFPRPEDYSAPGMSLRDYFAAMAMQALVHTTEARFWMDTKENAANRAASDCDNVVLDAYRIADAMLEEREQ